VATIQLLSDIHLEFHRDGGDEFIRSLDPTGVDVLVLAGDICTLPGLKSTLTKLCDRYPEVVFVTGNHEYYGSSPTKVHDLLTKVAASTSNLHWLHHTKVVLSGIRFAGTTLWFPFPSPSIYATRTQMNDYTVIKDFEPWVYEENTKAVRFLAGAAPYADVVVTHHLPALETVSPRYRGSSLNHYFCHDQTKLILEARPPLWVFGHTHDCVDMQVEGTRLLCNPLGYPQEQGDKRRGVYRPQCLIEVHPRNDETPAG